MPSLARRGENADSLAALAWLLYQGALRDAMNVAPKYLRLSEAAERLRKKTDEPITEEWVLRLASEGRLNLWAIAPRWFLVEVFVNGVATNTAVAPFPVGSHVRLQLGDAQLILGQKSQAIKLQTIQTEKGVGVILDAKCMAREPLSLQQDDLRVETAEIDQLLNVGRPMSEEQESPASSLSPKIADHEEACAAAEYVRNGERIDWRYWADRQQISTEQAAKLVHCIDPITWPDQVYAQGSIPPDLREEVSRLIEWLSERSQTWTLAELVRTIGNGVAPASMKSLTQCASQAEESASPETKQVANASTNHWPWGDHETELLRMLAEAAAKFWKLYDPNDPSTAPTNAHVKGWLKDQGVSDRVAEVMAQILRADDLPPGPRKK